MPRYFIAIDGFGDQTALVRFTHVPSPGGWMYWQGALIMNDGSERKSSMKIRQAEKAVRFNSWKEISEEQAFAIMPPPESRRGRADIAADSLCGP